MLRTVVSEDIRWGEGNIKLILAASCTLMSRFPEFEIPVLSYAICGQRKKQREERSYVFIRLLEVISNDIQENDSTRRRMSKRRSSSWGWKSVKLDRFSAQSAEPSKDETNILYFIQISPRGVGSPTLALLSHEIAVRQTLSLFYPSWHGLISYSLINGERGKDEKH